jgi:hypothetical protein
VPGDGRRAAPTLLVDGGDECGARLPPGFSDREMLKQALVDLAAGLGDVARVDLVERRRASRRIGSTPGRV